MTFSVQRVDNTPNITKAVEWDDHQSGLDVDLEQLPQNLVEVEIGGIGSPFLLRLIHQKRNSIPTTIQVLNTAFLIALSSSRLVLFVNLNQC